MRVKNGIEQPFRSTTSGEQTAGRNATSGVQTAGRYHTSKDVKNHKAILPRFMDYCYHQGIPIMIQDIP